MWTPETQKYKLIILAGITAITLAIHYGWIIEPLFGHVHWFHALHGRFCYIPIVVAASWFGLRGGVYSATVISALVLPYIFGSDREIIDLVAEFVEIVFYYFIGILIGALVDREFLARRRQQQAEIQVERSQKLSLVGQMAASVAHEVKNPLASIKGAADILTDNSTSDKARAEFKDILQKEIRRIDATVTEFLDFARPRETKLELVELSEVVTTCVRQVSTQAYRSGVSFENQVKEGLRVKGDGEKLHQMTLNLVLNAIQASPEGGIVRVVLNRAETFVRLRIIDAGEGMDDESLKRAFDPFYTTKASGTGLGLAIVKSIVDNHGGQIVLTGNIGRGTIATVDLPAWKNGA